MGQGTESCANLIECRGNGISVAHCSEEPNKKYPLHIVVWQELKKQIKVKAWKLLCFYSVQYFASIGR